MLLNLGSLVSALGMGAGTIRHATGPKLQEALVEDHSSADKIAVLRLEGIISSDRSDGGFSMVDVVKAQLEAAKEDDHVRAVILRVDSPGGEVLASDEIYRLISDFQKQTQKPVVASMGNLAASGGYYVSTPCRWIVANELTITGSIGVIMSSLNYRSLMDKVGLYPMVFKSGKYKDILSGSRKLEDIPEEEQAMIKGLINETYGKFKDVISTGREAAYAMNANGPLKSKQLINDWTEFADGRVFLGVEAMRMGFVDQVGNFNDAVETARTLAGVKSANVVEFQQFFDLGDFFRMFGKTKTPVMKVDLGLQPSALKPGCMYFLYSVMGESL